jgi:hypothetical protein
MQNENFLVFSGKGKLESSLQAEKLRLKPPLPRIRMQNENWKLEEKDLHFELLKEVTSQ